ncbi:MAG: FHA domain-containing protein [Polyangiaceae bacterium]|nr:FHA domain-containing protein [Polyangiaceae bacterium]
MQPSDDPTRPAASSFHESDDATGFTIIVVGPEDSGRTFELVDGRYLLGRAPEADIRLSLETISRRHALIVVQGDQVTIEDLGSRVGTFVNGRRVTSCSLPAGARIVCGGITMKLLKGKG